MEAIPPLPDDILELGQRLIPRPVFLIGCARSGTSILGEALASHPDVAYLFEASYIWNSVVPGKSDHRLTAVDATADVASQVYSALAEEKKKVAGTLLLEKNPKHVLRIPFLTALFPQARFLHVIRDGRDVAASLMFRNRGERWGHLEIPGWQKLLADYPEKNHIRCAHQWVTAVSIARADAQEMRHENYLELRYEELVEAPGAVLQKGLEFLGLTLGPAVTAFAEKIQDATAGSYHAKKQVRHYIENHKRRVGRYRENLTGQEIAEVEDVCGTLLSELGYEREGKV